MMRIMILFLGWNALSIAAPAHASDQTVENAQEFIRKVVSASPQTIWTQGVQHSAIPGVRATFSVETDRRCVTSFEYHNPVTGTSSKHTSDWSEVTTVRQNKRYVEYHLRSDRGDRLIELESEDMAVRVAYAIEFLKTQCDPTAELGF